MNLAVQMALALMLMQGRVPLRQMSPTGISGANTEAVATFAGTFKTIDKKFLIIEVEDGQVMRMYVTGSTKFVRDGKPSKAADFHTGESVTVDASRDARMNLLAVQVTKGQIAEDKDKPKDKGSNQN
jgi:hypothetical protein